MILKRQEYNIINRQLQNQKILILYGTRQVGKSFILKQIYEGIKYQKLWLHGEKEETALQFRNTDTFLSSIQAEGIDIKKKTYIFIDEFHHIPQISQKLKIIYDTQPKIKFLVSGSSALSTNNNLQESLSGRTYFLKLNPLRFKEYLENFKPKAYQIYKTLNIKNDARIDTLLSKQIELLDILNYGLYPEVLLTKGPGDKIDVLDNIITNYIKMDSKAFIRDINPVLFNDLLELLANNMSNLLSINSLSENLKIKYRKVEDYLYVLLELLIVHKLRPFSSKLTKEIQKSPKLYFADTGIRNFFLKIFASTMERPDIGQLLENFVWSELNKNIDKTSKLNYWRTKQGTEIDFIVTRGLKRLLIEVKSAKYDKIPHIKRFDSFRSIYADKDTLRVIIHGGDTFIREKDQILLPVGLTARAIEVFQ